MSGLWFSTPGLDAKRESFSRWLLVAIVAALPLAAGCAASPGRIVDSPMSLDEQQQAVLKLAPIGTPRAEVEKRLKAAGISFTPGYNDSIYYCALWNRPDGERWEMNVALLFDSSGAVYQARPANAVVGAGDAASPASQQPASGRSGWQAARRTPAAAPEGESPEDRPRVPFIGADGQPATAR